MSVKLDAPFIIEKTEGKVTRFQTNWQIALKKPDIPSLRFRKIPSPNTNQKFPQTAMSQMIHVW